VNDLIFAEKIGAKGSIVHTGSHKGTGFDSIVPVVADSIAQVLTSTPPTTKLYLEIASGGNGKVGSTFEELATLLRAVHNPRLGVCLDTAHMFAGGYTFDTPEKVTALAQKIAETISWSAVECIHTNDSKTALSSFLDRHENIGHGALGSGPFKLLLHNTHFGQLPFILEVPGMDGKSGPDKENMDRLKALI
jgi:deoxyribonuclease-4